MYLFIGTISMEYWELVRDEVFRVYLSLAYVRAIRLPLFGKNIEVCSEVSARVCMSLGF